MGYIKLYNVNDILYVIYYVESTDTNIKTIDISKFLYIVINDCNIKFDIFYKAWIFNIMYLDNFLEKYSNNYYIEIDDTGKQLELYTDIGNTLKLKPFEYQREIVDFILRTKNVLLVSPCGSGNR